jgi:hypothetical protein
MPSARPPTQLSVGSGPPVSGGGAASATAGLLAHVSDPVDAHDGTAITYDGGPPWHDGSTNPPLTVDQQIDKIIGDLASVAGSGGADKIGVGARPTTWFNSDPNPAGSIFDAFDALVDDLAVGDGDLKIRYSGGPNWADATTNPVTSVGLQIDKIISDLASNVSGLSSKGGAGLIGCAIRTSWSNYSVANPVASIYEAIDKIIRDLSSTDASVTARGGSGLIGYKPSASWYDGDLATWHDGTGPILIPSVGDQLDNIVNVLGSVTASHSGAHNVGCAGRIPWIDSTSNSATTSVLGAINKVIDDLGGDTPSGAAKIGIGNIPNWFGGISGDLQTSSNLKGVVDELLIDLSSSSSTSGAHRIGCAARTTWVLDSTTNPLNSIWGAVDKIIVDLSDQTGTTPATDDSGATKIGCHARTNWLDGITNPHNTTVHAAIDKIITDLAVTSGAQTGATKVGVEITSTWENGQTVSTTDVQSVIREVVSELADKAGAGTDGASRIGVEVHSGHVGFPQGNIRNALISLSDGAAGLTVANTFTNNNIFTDNVEMRDAPTTFGTNMLNTIAKMEIARLTIVRGAAGTATRTLIAELTAPTPLVGSECHVRLYRTSGPVEAFEIAVNCYWAETIPRWHQENNSLQSTLFVYTYGGQATYEKDAGAVATPWEDNTTPTGWDTSCGSILFGGDTIESIQDGTMQYTGAASVSNSNPAITTAPLSNALYSKNIPKAWGLIRLGNPPRPSVSQGFNIQSEAGPTPPKTPVYSAGYTLVDIDFHSTLLDSAHSVVVTIGRLDATTAGNDYFPVVFNKTGSGFSIGLYKASLGAVVDLRGLPDTFVSFVVFGVAIS